MKPWFKARALADNPRRAHVVIDRPIGSDYAPDWIKDFTGEKPAREFIAAVDALGELDEIHLEMNCPGGDVASGVRIFHYLKDHPAQVHVKVTGQAASIAVVIVMAGDTRVMGIGTTMMTHRASSLMMGFYNAKEMRDTADNLSKFDDAIVDLFVMVTGKSAEEVNGLLDQGDTVMSADEALEWGFITDKDAKLQAVACSDPAMFMQQLKDYGELVNLRAQLAGQQTTMSAADALALAFDLTPEEAEAQAADLGDQIIALRQQASTPIAKIEDVPQALLDEIKAMGPGKIQIDNSVQEAVAAERTRVNSIIKACQTTGQPQLMEKLISNGMDTEQATGYVFDVAAAHGEGQHIHNSHSPEGGQAKQANVNYANAYARFNRKPAKA